MLKNPQDYATFDKNGKAIHDPKYYPEGFDYKSEWIMAENGGYQKNFEGLSDREVIRRAAIWLKDNSPDADESDPTDAHPDRVHEGDGIVSHE